MEELPSVVPEPGDGCALVPAVEGSEEVPPVLSVEEQEGGGLGDEVGHEEGPLHRGQVPGGQPGIGVDHVGGDQGVLEIEGGQVAFGREDGLGARSARLGRVDLPGVVRTRACSMTEGRWMSRT